MENLTNQDEYTACYAQSDHSRETSAIFQIRSKNYVKSRKIFGTSTRKAKG